LPVKTLILASHPLRQRFTLILRDREVLFERWNIFEQCLNSSKLLFRSRAPLLQTIDNSCQTAGLCLGFRVFNFKLLVTLSMQNVVLEDQFLQIEVHRKDSHIRR
jgi:hypothetical protein